MPLGRGGLADAVDSDEHVELTCFRTDLGRVEMKVANRRGCELLLGRLVTLEVRQAADAMPLQTARPRGAGQVRQRGLQGIQAVIKRQPRMLAKRDQQRFCLRRQACGAGWLRAHGRIVPGVRCGHFATGWGGKSSRLAGVAMRA